MIAAWMLYATVVATLMSLAARALERASAVLGGARRWPWVAAASASLVLPAFTILGLGPAGGSSRLLPGGAGGTLRAALEPLFVVGGAAGRVTASGLEGIEFVLLGAWFLGSGVLALLYLRSGRILARSRFGAERVTAESLGVGAVDGVALAGIPILLTDEFGPAVVGYRGGQVLLPRWCLELSPEERALVLAHELEHLKSGDVRLLVAARCALVLLPWLLPLWWQVHRLRLAVEIDCDGRVLRRDVRLARYGELLLEVGRRRRACSVVHAVAALAEPRSNLERRIHAMTESKPRRRWLHATIAAVAAASFIAVACESPSPAENASADDRAETVDEPPVPARAEAPTGTDGAGPAEPSYVPRDVEPRLLNGEELSEALRERVADGGPEGSATLMMFIDRRGRVTETRVEESSGHEELDATAEEVMKLARFEPAKNGDEAVSVWVLQRVQFHASE